MACWPADLEIEMDRGKDLIGQIHWTLRSNPGFMQRAPTNDVAMLPDWQWRNRG